MTYVLLLSVMLLFLVLSVFYSVKNIESKEKNDPVSLNVSTYFVKKKADSDGPVI